MSADPPAPSPAEELARLMPGLSDLIARLLRDLRGPGQPPGILASEGIRLARACELLLAERAARPEPHPLAPIVAEVLARGAVDTYGTEIGAGLTPAEHADLADRLLRAKGGRFPPTERDRMVMAARVLLAGIQACDAAAKGDERA